MAKGKSARRREKNLKKANEGNLAKAQVCTAVQLQHGASTRWRSGSRAALLLAARRTLRLCLRMRPCS